MLELRGVHFYYGHIHALQGVSLEVGAGQVVCLIGSNGAGKSSTLMAICGVNAISEGEILLEGEAIHARETDEIVRRGICQVPEGRRIFPLLSVLENLEMGAFLRNDAAGVKNDLDNVYSLFPVLYERRAQRGGTLSGGEQQMLAIARALMAKPRLLLLDEPSLGLAPRIVETIFEVLARIRDEGTGIFLVEQNAHPGARLLGLGVCHGDRAHRHGRQAGDIAELPGGSGGLPGRVRCLARRGASDYTAGRPRVFTPLERRLPMLYEMRIYTLTPGGVAEFEENFAQVIEKRNELSPIVGFFHSEVGDLNRVMHIWRYENSDHRAEVRAKTVSLDWWPPPSGHLILDQESKILLTPSFREEPRQGALGNVYEFRTYTVKPGKMNEVLSRWTEHIAAREELSPLAACFMTEMGPLNQWIHVWAYDDMNHRAEIRKKAHALPNWPPGSRPFLDRQNAEIWVPASFSPMH